MASLSVVSAGTKLNSSDTSAHFKPRALCGFIILTMFLGGSDDYCNPSPWFVADFGGTCNFGKRQFLGGRSSSLLQVPWKPLQPGSSQHPPSASHPRLLPSPFRARLPFPALCSAKTASTKSKPLKKTVVSLDRSVITPLKLHFHLDFADTLNLSLFCLLGKHWAVFGMCCLES